MALNLTLRLFFLSSPRWHVFCKWAIIRGCLHGSFHWDSFPVFCSLTFSQENGLLECFCGKIKMKSLPPKSSSHIPPHPPAARVSTEWAPSSLAFDQLSSWSFPPSFPGLSLSYTVRLPFSLPFGSVNCTGWEFLRCPQIFESSSPRGSARPWWSWFKASGVFRKLHLLLCALEGLDWRAWFPCLR